jgi:uncharacterized protein with HEPN domain
VSRDERERLRDIKDAIVAIQGHLSRTSEASGRKHAEKQTKEEAGKQSKEPTRKDDSSLLHDALLFQFVIIGEAVKHLTPETRESVSEVPWPDIAGLRDLIAHEYFRIDMNRVLQIVERDLPPLEAAIDRLLGE